jgi:hypothetical protein
MPKTRLFREVSSAIPAESRQFRGENGSGEACLAATGKFMDLMVKGLIHGTPCPYNILPSNHTSMTAATLAAA